jgi:hypothetical protein
MAPDPSPTRSARLAAATSPYDRKPGLFETPAEGFRIIAWWCLINLIAAMLCLMLMQWAFAHDPAHPEWNGWLTSQHNQNGAMCCDGNDTLVLGDHEWRIDKGDYEVL